MFAHWAADVHMTECLRINARFYFLQLRDDWAHFVSRGGACDVDKSSRTSEQVEIFFVEFMDLFGFVCFSVSFYHKNKVLWAEDQRGMSAHMKTYKNHLQHNILNIA